MKNINEIHESLKDATLILIVNITDDKNLLDVVCNFIYRKYKGKKINIKSGKGLYRKLCTTTNKFIKIDIDYGKLQFTSSKSRKGLEISEIKCKGVENDSMFLFKYDKKIHEIWRYRWSNYFDIIMAIDNNKINILKSSNEEFSIEQLIRASKLRNLKKKFPF